MKGLKKGTPPHRKRGVKNMNNFDDVKGVLKKTGKLVMVFVV